MKVAVLAFSLLCCVPAFAKTQPEFKSAKVISQNLGSEDRGYAVMPVGTMLAGVPITRHTDVVVLETVKHRITLSEVGNKFVVLPVGETIQFYQDGNFLIVLDSKKKKHKFSLVHAETIENETKAR